MIFYITFSDAESITQQVTLRSIARALSVDYVVNHYTQDGFICEGVMPDCGQYLAESRDNLYLVNANHPNVLFSTLSFAIVQSDDPMPVIRQKYGNAIKLGIVKFR